MTIEKIREKYSFLSSIHTESFELREAAELILVMCNEIEELTDQTNGQGQGKSFLDEYNP